MVASPLPAAAEAAAAAAAAEEEGKGRDAGGSGGNRAPLSSPAAVFLILSPLYQRQEL